MLPDPAPPQYGPPADCCGSEWKFEARRTGHAWDFVCLYCETHWHYDTWARVWKRKAGTDG